MPEKSKTYEKKSPRVYIRTFGCQMNERDSEIICSLMIDEGYQSASAPDEANLVIYNTCSVRKHAEDRVWGNLGDLKKLKEDSRLRGNDIVIGLVGCMGKAYEKSVFERLPHVDFVCGPANIYEIPEVVERIRSGENHIVATDKETRPIKMETPSHSLRSGTGQAVRAFVNISEGCNNFCSYCIVPYVRGREISRPLGDITDEIKALVDAGIKEVTLLGQNVNSYQLSALGSQFSANSGFVRLLEEINKIKDLKRIRFMSSHPKDASVELFKAMRDLDKVCEHLHLPLQSGSDRILKDMKRGYTSLHYMNLIDQFRKELPDSAISTDLIVGFPSEKDEDFMDTNMLMKKIQFDSAFIFKYSPRPFTKAAKLKDDVLKQIKEERNQSLLNLQEESTRDKLEGSIGKEVESLGIRGAKRRPQSSSDADSFFVKGRTRKGVQVVYKGDKDLIGKIVSVKIRDVESNTLLGELV